MDDTVDNFKYIVECLFGIKDVRQSFAKKNRKHISETEFYDDEMDVDY